MDGLANCALRHSRDIYRRAFRHRGTHGSFYRAADDSCLLFFYYGLSPEARWSIMEKDAFIDQKGISLGFTDERMKTHAIGWDDVRYIIEKDDVVMLMLQGKRYTCFMLPSSAVDPDVAQALRQFTAQIH